MNASIFVEISMSDLTFRIFLAGDSCFFLFSLKSQTCVDFQKTIYSFEMDFKDFMNRFHIFWNESAAAAKNV